MIWSSDCQANKKSINSDTVVSSSYDGDVRHMVVGEKRSAQHWLDTSRYLTTFVHRLWWDIEWPRLGPDSPRDYVMGIVTDCPFDQNG